MSNNAIPMWHDSEDRDRGEEPDYYEPSPGLCDPCHEPEARNRIAELHTVLKQAVDAAHWNTVRAEELGEENTRLRSELDQALKQRGVLARRVNELNRRLHGE